MTSRRGVIVSAIAAALVSIALIAPAVAADPTTISVSPKEQFSNGCNPSASWTIGLSGGLSGQFHTTVSYGDGSSAGFYTSGTFNNNHTFFSCYTAYLRTQYWQASRAGGGTTPYFSTKVHVN